MEKVLGRTRIERSKKGYITLWECGGGYTSTGESRIICDRDGNPKKAIYIRKSGHLSNSRHALIVVESGDYIITAYHHRKDFTIKVHRIGGFVNWNDVEYALTEPLYEFYKGEWDKQLPECLNAAVQAAQDKASCYHCREPHYVL